MSPNHKQKFVQHFIFQIFLAFTLTMSNITHQRRKLRTGTTEIEKESPKWSLCPLLNSRQTENSMACKSVEHNEANQMVSGSEKVLKKAQDNRTLPPPLPLPANRTTSKFQF